jgi:sugar O-acyltransferase (sialic acid O-acetyltransferase NeuD family)
MEKIRKIIILGTAGNAIDIAETIIEINKTLPEPIYKCIGFLDDDESRWGKKHAGIKVLGPLTNARKFPQAYFINGIGNDTNFTKKEAIINQVGVSLERFVALQHPTSSVSKSAKIGFGTMVFQNVTIASNVEIGNHVIVFPNAIISHEVKIADYAHVTGGVSISGRVNIGKSCYLGTNACVKGDVTIGKCSLIGMGAVVIDNVPANSVFVGNPARFLRATK